MNKLILGDCLEELPKLKSNSVDLVLTDPPFFLPTTHYQSRQKWQKHYADLTPLKSFWTIMTKEIIRVLKPSGHCFVFCNAESYPVFFEPMYNNFDKIKSIIWDKKRVGLGRIFRHQHELIIWARWSEHKIINDKKLRSDVISMEATPSKDRDHPVEKPVALLEYLMKPTTHENDVVLDPFMGGGSTILAAKRLNRQYIGIEMNETYLQNVNKKLQKESYTLLNFN